MSMKTIVNGLINFAGPTGLKAQKLAPEIFLGVGIGGILISTFLACRATLKVEGIMGEHKEKVDMIHRATQRAKDGLITPGEYSEKDGQKDLAMTYIQTGGAFLKAYGPAIAILTLSLGSIIKGHNIMKGRNLALIAAYKGIQEAFNAYRKRVVEEHGEKVDFMYKNGIRAVEVTKPAYTDENGKEVAEEKVTVMTSDGSGVSAYARYFEKEYILNGVRYGSSQWSGANDYNHYFLVAQQNYFNDILKIRGHVFLNEVYDALGFERTEAGSIVGWVRNGNGDNFIDFGVFDPETKEYLPLRTSEDGCIIVDFNVDGVIYGDFTKVKI